MRSKLLKANLFCLSLLLFKSVAAHEFWLEASPFRSDRDNPVDISIHIGENLTGKTLPNFLNWYLDFSYTGEQGLADVPGEVGADPAGTLEGLTARVTAVGFHGERNRITFKRAKFQDYLDEYRLSDRIRLDQDPFQTEYYSRFAKLLVFRSDLAGPDNSSQVFGYPLELIPEQGPYDLAQGEPFTLRVLFRDSAMAGLPVTAFCAERPQQRQLLNTDDLGRVRVRLNCRGLWLVHALHMVPVDDGEADWESFWASLTFFHD